jgi:hypothetical protein
MLFKKKSTWEKLTDPVSRVADQAPVRSGLAAVVTAVGVTVASAAVSAVRRRQGTP